MTSNRPDFDDIRLNSDEPDTDLDTLDDLDQELLDDDFEDPAPRPKKRKSMSMLTLVLLLVLVVVGGAFALLSNDTVSRAVIAPAPAPTQQPVPDVAAVPPAPVATPDIPAAPDAAAPSDTAAIPAMPEVTNVPPPPQEFADLPQPTPVSNDPDVAAVGPVPDAADAVPPMPVDPKATSATPAVPEIPNMPADITAAAPAPEVAPKPATEPGTAIVPVPAPSTEPGAKLEMGTAKVEPITVTPDMPPAADTKPAAPVVAATTPAKDAVAKTDGPKPEVVKPETAKVDAKVVDAKDMGKPAETMKPAVVSTKSVETKPEEVKPTASKPPVEPLKKPSDTKVDMATSPMPPPVPAADDSSDYYQATETVQTLSKATAPKFTIPDDQRDRGLGVNVAGQAASDPEGMISAANKALDLGRYDTALEMFETLYKKNKRDERILMGRAVSLQRLGRNEEAVKAYDELLAINPNNPDVATNMLGLVRQQNPGVALQRLLELRARYPQNATVAAQTGLANASVGNLEEGIRYLNIAASLEPENPKHYFNMGIIAEKLGKPDMAIAAYEKALTADATSDDDKNHIDRDVVYDRLSVLRQRQ